MKNVLIPTQLKPDTLNALRAAINYSTAGCTVTLLLPQEITNSFSAAAVLRNIGSDISKSQKEVLQSCREIIKNTPGCTIKIHNQPGISASLVKNIINSFNIELIIIPAGYEMAKNKIHKHCLQLLLNSKCPILHLGPYCREQDFSKVFYIEHNKCPVKAEAVIQIIKSILPVETITSKKIFSDDKDSYICPHLAEEILNNKTDLLIETRRPERVSLTKKIKSPAERLGISVLSISEGAI